MITIDGYAIDCTTNETHTSENDATEYNIEQPEPGKEGSVMTDHVRSKARELVLQGFVVDTPIGRMVAVRNAEAPRTNNPLLEGALKGAGDPDFQHSATAFQTLQDIADTHRPVTVVTSIKTYRGVVMTSLVVTKDKDSWGRLPFTASFKKFVFVSIGRNSTTRVGFPGASGRADLGDKTRHAPLAYGTFCEERNEATGQCLHQIIVEKRADGKWYQPGHNGKALSKDELDAWSGDQKDLKRNTATYDKDQGEWVDPETGLPISKRPGRAFWKPDSPSAEPAQPGKTSDEWWERVRDIKKAEGKN